MSPLLLKAESQPNSLGYIAVVVVVGAKPVAVAEEEPEVEVEAEAPPSLKGVN